MDFKFKFSKRSTYIALGIFVAGVAIAGSPWLQQVESAYKGATSTKEPQCQDGSNQEKQKCSSSCKQAISDAKQNIEKALQKARMQDAANVSSNGSTTGGVAKNMQNKQHSGMDADLAAKAAGAKNLSSQAANARTLIEPGTSCAEKVKSECQGAGQDAEQKAQQMAKSCQQGAQAAQKAAAEKDAQAKEMGDQAKKDDKNGQGMQPPQMPQMPQQQEKQSGVASNTNTATATPVAASGLGGNQLGNQQVAIGGDEKKTDATTATTTGYGGRTFGASGISTSNDPSFDGAGNFGAGGNGARNASGSSSMGSFGGSGGSDGSAAAAEQAAAVPQPQKQEDLEAFSNGGARPSYLGMKSKGNELADLGLDGGTGTGSSSLGDPASEDRSLASTEQGAASGTEDQSGSLFNMIHSRLEEIGRRGSI